MPLNNLSEKILLVDSAGNVLLSRLREDDVHASGDAGIMTLAVQKATPADLSGTDGDYEPLQVKSGSLWVAPRVKGTVSGDTELTGATATDAMGQTASLHVISKQMLLNGSTWDQQRNNIEGTVLASAARTATTSSADQTNYNAKGVLIHLNVTANPGGAETLNTKISWKDPVSGNYQDLLTSGAQAFGGGTGNISLLLYPGVAAASEDIDYVKGYALGRTWRVSVVHSASGSWTYSVGYALIL